MPEVPLEAWSEVDRKIAGSEASGSSKRQMLTVTAPLGALLLAAIVLLYVRDEKAITLTQGLETKVLENTLKLQSLGDITEQLKSMNKKLESLGTDVTRLKTLEEARHANR